MQLLLLQLELSYRKAAHAIRRGHLW